MSKRIPFLLLIVPIASLVMFACTNCGERTAAATEPETLKAGTKFSAILMKPLESGVSEEGEDVPLLVTEDVKGAGGRVILKKGAKAKARIAWSRREDVLGGLTNRPARLHIQLVETTAIDGTPVPLAADAKLAPDSTFELNRANTGIQDPSPELKSILEDPANTEAVETLAELVSDGKLSEEVQTPEGRQKLAELCEKLGLGSTAELAKRNELSSVPDLIRDSSSAGTVLALATGQAPLALDAVIETAKFVSTVPSRLSRALRGRNIKAYIGTPVEAYVAKDVNVRVP